MTFKENKDAPLAVIHDFVKKLPALKKDFTSLNQHINIAELLKRRTDSKAFRDQWQGERGMLEGESYLDAIEEMVYADTDRTALYRILRLLCMQSVTADGIRTGRYETIRRAIGQNYGLQHLFTLGNLERSGNPPLQLFATDLLVTPSSQCAPHHNVISFSYLLLLLLLLLLQA